MAIINNTYSTTAAAGKQNRETIITDLIYRTDPEETPLFSYIDREKIKGTKPEWLQTSLRTPNPDNAKLEGDQYTFNAINQPSRVSNQTQIVSESGIVSMTQQAVDHVGATDVARAKLEKGIEIRRDVEASFLSNNASVGGTTRKSAGLRAWLTTNDLFSAGGASGGFNTGTTVVDAATNGTNQRAFTKSLMDAALLSAYSAGGKPTVCFLAPYAKSVFSTFMSDANVVPNRLALTSARQQATIIGAADAYLSDWGLVDFVPNRIMSLVSTLARNVYFVTPDMLASGFLRDIAEDPDVVPNADAEPFVIIGEFTLIVRHEKAHAVVADVFGLTAAS